MLEGIPIISTVLTTNQLFELGPLESLSFINRFRSSASTAPNGSRGACLPAEAYEGGFAAPIPEITLITR
jgi:hypothetical protein